MEMVLTIFLGIVVCGAVTMMMIAAVAFIQDKKMFSSAPKEAQEVIIPREKELFYGSRAIGWTIMIISFLIILGVFVIGVWDGLRSGFSFWDYFIRFVVICTIYKLYDMIFFDYFFLIKYKFFQFYFPEIESAFEGRKYGFNIVSQLVKLIIIFPAFSALIGGVCTTFLG